MVNVGWWVSGVANHHLILLILLLSNLDSSKYSFYVYVKRCAWFEHVAGKLLEAEPPNGIVLVKCSTEQEMLG